MSKLTTLVLAGTLCAASVGAIEFIEDKPQRDPSLLHESRAAVARALRHLKGAQKPDGSWSDDPAVTALVVSAMIGSKQDGFGVADEPVARALDFIRSNARPDGAIYARFYPNYTTSLCAMALAAAAQPQDLPLLRKARAYLLGLQADDLEGIYPDNPQFGGWGYEPNPDGQGMRRPDLSNTQFALEALRTLEKAVGEEPIKPGGSTTGTELAYERAITYLTRCQNLSTNDQPWATADGGFVYRPGESKAGFEDEGKADEHLHDDSDVDDARALRSYGGMTYAGLKSMAYAHLTRDDPRVRAAWQWACSNWSVSENPGLGQQGLFYYYMTMARALQVLGEDQVVEPDGTKHDWRVELVGRLLEVQKADGTWFNDNGRWMEQIPDLVTAYAVIAINHATAEWQPLGDRGSR